MILVITLLVIIIFIGYMLYLTKGSEYDTFQSRKIEETKQWLYHAINAICYHCDINLSYTIMETDTITHIDGEIVYLVMWDTLHGRVYSNNKLLYDMINELSKRDYVSPDKNINSVLLTTAKNLGYYYVEEE